MSEPDSESGRRTAARVLYAAGPVPMSFLHRYLLAIVPVVLVLLCIVVRSFLQPIFYSVSPATSPPAGSVSVPGLAGTNPTILSQSLGMGFSDLPTLLMLTIAPFGLFLIVILIGWMLRSVELWAGPALTLGLSLLVAAVIVLAGGMRSQNLLLHLLRWVAFLVQPFSILATGLILLWVHRFRQSIRYEITDSFVTIRGGIWPVQERRMPLSQIGNVIVKQGFLGAWYGYGTVNMSGKSRWKAEISRWGIGGRKDHSGTEDPATNGNAESSQSPLACLYGIPDPKTAQRIIMDRITRLT